MKLYMLFLLTLFSLPAAPDGGDDDYYRKNPIDCYEPTLNIQYMSISDSMHVLDSKNKVKIYWITSNVAVYDIAKKQINYIFPDSVKRSIVGFHFESDYIEEYKTMEFNNLYDRSASYDKGLYSFSNNFNVVKREPSNNLIIITKDPIGNNTIIWICDKYGNNLRKGLEFGADWDWEIDVKNQSIRISRQVNLKIEFQQVSY